MYIARRYCQECILPVSLVNVYQRRTVRPSAHAKIGANYNTHTWFSPWRKWLGGALNRACALITSNTVLGITASNFVLEKIYIKLDDSAFFRTQKLYHRNLLR